MESLKERIQSIYLESPLHLHENHFILFDSIETFHQRYPNLSDIYGVCILDKNEIKRQLFECVDTYGDKICHITPHTISVSNNDSQYRIYIYVKSNMVETVFSRYDVPLQEIIHSVRFRDYFSLERFSKTLTIYCKTDYILDGSFSRWLNNERSRNGKKIIVITGSADYEINNRMVEHLNSTVAYWFGTNMLAQKSNVYGIPLGITSYDPRTTSSSFLFRYGDNSEYHRILADDSCIEKSWNIKKNSQWPIYMNFSSHTHYDRSRVWNLFKEHSLVHANIHENTYEGRNLYFEDMRKSEFSICPRGNGIDTHRFWESLYAGVYPIIQKEPIHTYFEGLPYVTVNEWNPLHITETFLKDTHPFIHTPTPNYHKLYVSYWIEQIERKSVLLI